MITQSTRNRLRRMADKALWEAGLTVPQLLDAAAAFPLVDAAGRALEGDPAELRRELEAIAWLAAAQGQPARLAADDDAFDLAAFLAAEERAC